MPLASLDPDAALDDLEPLRDLIGAARVVGIGESAHYVREYGLLRHRLVRFLVERMGFTLVAVESGFSEGLVVDRWIHGGDGTLAEIADRGLTYRFGRSAEMRGFLEWMRQVNSTGGAVTYAGLDLPGGLASLLPALDNLDRYLAGVDADGGELVARARGHAEKFAGPHTLPAFVAYRAMDAANRNDLTLLLTELAARFDTLRPFYVRRACTAGYETARHELRMAGMLDQMLRAQHEAAEGSAAHAGLNVRDAAMAETALRLLGHGSGRMVVLAGNTHLQRVPMRISSELELPVTGTYLADELRDGYLAIAVTCGGGRTPSRRPAPSAPSGIELVDVDLAEPVADSVEAMLHTRDRGLHLTNLRPLRSAGGATSTPQRIRCLDSYTEVPVAHGFDLVAGVPSISPLPPDER
jgi:erythromycin esterase